MGKMEAYLVSLRPPTADKEDKEQTTELRALQKQQEELMAMCEKDQEELRVLGQMHTRNLKTLRWS